MFTILWRVFYRLLPIVTLVLHVSYLTSPQMSSKHPLTTDSVTFGKRAGSPDVTSDCSGSGDPTLVQWRRRPYDGGYPTSGNTTDVGGVSNRFAFELPPASPTSPIGDLDFDAKPSSTYQSLTDLPQKTSPNYEDINKLGGTGTGRERQSLSCIKCSLVFLGVIALVSFVVACGGVALAGIGYFVQHPPQEDKISTLESQLSESRAIIDQLSSMVEQLHQNTSSDRNFNNAKIEQLFTDVSVLSGTVETIINPPNVTVPIETKSVNLSSSCYTEQIQTCSISQGDVTPVDGSQSNLPNFGSCVTPGASLNVTETYIRDMFCAITNQRTERNPQIATLRVDTDTTTVVCYCFVTALEARRGVVDCSLFVTRCPHVVTFEL